MFSRNYLIDSFIIINSYKSWKYLDFDLNPSDYDAIVAILFETSKIKKKSVKEKMFVPTIAVHIDDKWMR